MSTRTVITQGEFFVTGQEGNTIETVLGSCVACCLWDQEKRVGGMNHMLLAHSRAQSDNAPDFAGVNAMELLINGLIKQGARRDRLQAKAFGGARMIEGLSDIGPANSAFVLDFLKREGIPCVAQSLGGDQARRIVFVATSGAVRVKTNPRSDIVEEVAVQKPTSEIELFG